METWQPSGELMSLRQTMGKLFEDSFVRPCHFLGTIRQAEMPALDVYQTPNEVLVKATLSGVKSADVSIDITGETIIIKEETKAEQEIKKENYLYQERRHGIFSHSVTLHGGLRPDNAEATTEHGVLALTIPKAEEVKPKATEVKAKGKPKEKK
jgi:HSP20 family protein